MFLELDVIVQKSCIFSDMSVEKHFNLLTLCIYLGEVRYNAALI